MHVGAITGQRWCADCAETLGLSVPFETRMDAMAGLDKKKLAAFAPEFTAAMRALKAKAGPRDLTARILGERE